MSEVILREMTSMISNPILVFFCCVDTLTIQFQNCSSQGSFFLSLFPNPLSSYFITVNHSAHCPLQYKRLYFTLFKYIIHNHIAQSVLKVFVPYTCWNEAASKLTDCRITQEDAINAKPQSQTNATYSTVATSSSIKAHAIITRYYNYGIDHGMELWRKIPQYNSNSNKTRTAMKISPSFHSFKM